MMHAKTRIRNKLGYSHIYNKGKNLMTTNLYSISQIKELILINVSSNCIFIFYIFVVRNVNAQFIFMPLCYARIGIYPKFRYFICLVVVFYVYNLVSEHIFTLQVFYLFPRLSSWHELCKLRTLH